MLTNICIVSYTVEDLWHIIFVVILVIRKTCWLQLCCSTCRDILSSFKSWLHPKTQKDGNGKLNIVSVEIKTAGTTRRRWLALMDRQSQQNKNKKKNFCTVERICLQIFVNTSRFFCIKMLNFFLDMDFFSINILNSNKRDDVKVPK